MTYHTFSVIPSRSLCHIQSTTPVILRPSDNVIPSTAKDILNLNEVQGQAARKMFV